LHREGSEPVNPRLHDEFVALCALFYSGEITDEEWALLQVHMAYCDSCQRTFEEFKHVAKEVMPSMASAAAAESANAPRESAATLEEAERRLMSRLETIPATEQTLVSKKRSKTLYAECTGADRFQRRYCPKLHSAGSTAVRYRRPNRIEAR
jgi:hypothetical protein